MPATTHPPKLLFGFKLSTWLIGLVVAIALTIAAVGLGKKTGAGAAQETIARLAILWPSLLTMPKDDRIIVVTAAATCHAYRLPASASVADISACLRTGAKEHDQANKGRAPIEERLEVLLRTANVR